MCTNNVCCEMQGEQTIDAYRQHFYEIVGYTQAVYCNCVKCSPIELLVNNTVFKYVWTCRFFVVESRLLGRALDLVTREHLNRLWKHCTLELKSDIDMKAVRTRFLNSVLYSLNYYNTPYIPLCCVAETLPIYSFLLQDLCQNVVLSGTIC